MLRRGFPNLTNTASTPSSSSSLRSLLSSASSSPPPFRWNRVPIAASGIADSSDDENIDSTHSSAVQPLSVAPRLLQPRVVVYDGLCHLCHRGVKWVIKADKDRKIKFCCVQSKAAEPYLTACGLEQEDVLRRFLFVEGLGSYSQGSTASLDGIDGSDVFAKSLHKTFRPATILLHHRLLSNSESLYALWTRHFQVHFLVYEAYSN